MQKKHALFTSGAGRGDHTRLLAINATLCVDTVDDFNAFYDYFDDIRAFVVSVEPPHYPYPIDRTLADEGRQVFEQRCSWCHGTYGPQGTYPNYLIPLDTIGTDPALAEYHVRTSAPAGAWLNGSVFTDNQARYDPSLAYVAPPLDGIWVTAPFLHNGSVPTLAALLESSTRPKYWTRSYDDPHAYDPAAAGWKFTRLDHGQADEPDAKSRRRIVDTTLPGFGNGGHTAGDSLSPQQRAAVIEYLKTL
jgi:mono/diheme cytochrome c family protein